MLDLRNPGQVATRVVLVFLVLYVVIRLAANYNSWSGVPPLGETRQTTDAGRQYYELLGGKTTADNRLLGILALVDQPSWVMRVPPPATAVVETATDLLKRGQIYYTRGDRARAVQILRLLLLWATRLGDARDEAAFITVGKAAADMASGKPDLLAHPTMRAYATDLIALLDKGKPPFDIPDAPGSGVKRLFSNRDLLLDMFREYAKSGGGSRFTQRSHLLAWIQLCPATLGMFSKALAGLDDQVKVRQQLASRLTSLLPPPASGMPPMQRRLSPEALPAGQL